MFKKRINEVMEKFKEEDVLGAFGSANFFGQESKRRLQIRGNGVLVLTRKNLYFELWHPKKILEIPISSIQDIETPKSHLGKTKFKKLLKVVFTNEEGETDSAAWLVNHPNEWKESLEKLIII